MLPPSLHIRSKCCQGALRIAPRKRVGAPTGIRATNIAMVGNLGTGTLTRTVLAGIKTPCAKPRVQGWALPFSSG